MAINLKFDLLGNPEPPSIVLANRNGNKLGQLNVNVESIDVSDKFNAASEFSFTLNKYIDDKPTPLWDKVKDFKLVYCPEWDLWFEIKVELDEATETVKTVFCTQLGQAELSQIKVYNIHINEEGDPNWDTNNETYKSTILYDKEHTETSLLDRLLKDKAPHYSIAYVDESIQRIQKTFSFDDTSICDAFDEIAEEIGCLFVYNSNTQADGKPNRTISVYDLQQNCLNPNCKHRGEFTDVCPKCNGQDDDGNKYGIKCGYGEDTTIFVTSDELATEGIQLVTDTDSVKNCFKLEGGDDLMTATIRNCNPNGSDYIWYFSDALKEDMSDELVDGIKEYDKDYQYYYNEYISKLDTDIVNQYNKLVEDFDEDGNLIGGYSRFYDTKSTCLNCGKEDYFAKQCPDCGSENILSGQKLQTISTEITGYPALMTAYYNTIDLLLYLKSGLMPNIEMSDTTAEEQLRLLTTTSLSPIAVNVKEINNASLTTANSAVLSMAKILIRPTYKVTIKENSSSLSELLSDSDGEYKTWTGKFVVTNYSDETDTATHSDNEASISVRINNATETFIKQKLEKALNKENTDDYSITGLFAKDYDEFCEEIKKYALNPLDNFSKACDTCLSILQEQGVGSNENDESEDVNKKILYDELYKPYFDKQQAINTEIKNRQDEIAIIEGVWDRTDENNPQCTVWGLQQYIEERQQDIQEELNFEKYLGEDLWLEFCTYRREDKYSNSNYISDGLNNAELFKRANEFIAVAEEEIFKSAELQHSISATLNNLLSLPKFKPLLKSFKTGNWIRVQVDDKVYKLRLLEYGFNYGNSKSISVEFSDVTKIKNGVTDVKEVLEQASSMASSYDSVQRQAEKGNVARSTIDQWLVDGLNAANMQIASNDSEEVLLTQSGLLARSYDDITRTYSPEQLKITHNIMAYTDDSWKTVKQAIGKHKYSAYDKESGEIVDNKVGYGMSAEFVTAGVVSGSQIIGGDVYSANYEGYVNDKGNIVSSKGSYIDLKEGKFSFAGGKLAYDGNDLTIVGKVEVTTAGKIACWNINDTSIYKGSSTFYDADGMYFGEQGLSLGNQFKVEPNGIATMTNANVSGTIKGSKIVGSNYLLIGDMTESVDNDGYIVYTENKDGQYAKIDEDGTLTCTNVDILGGVLKIGRYEVLDENGEAETDEDGNTIYGWNTWIDEDGILKTNESVISGTVYAGAGQIAGFAIEPVKDENGDTIGGRLCSSDKTIGTDKSIFLSATDMEGTMPFYEEIAQRDENGDVVTDDNGDTVFDIVTHDYSKTDWRLTIGNNFGVTSDGTAYMSNCEIVGGSLKVGSEDSGYYAWISNDGVLNASGANIDGKITAVEGRIAGWDIANDRIDKNGVVGMSSGDDSNVSLVDTSTQSPIRFYAGNQRLVKTETLTFTSTGETLTQTITLSEQEQLTYKVVGAQCFTATKLQSGSVVSKDVEVKTGNIAVSSEGENLYLGQTTLLMLPDDVLSKHITAMYSTNDQFSLKYLGKGQVQISATSKSPNTSVLGEVFIHYDLAEDLDIDTLDINITYDDTTVTVVFNPQTAGVKYDIDIEYIINVKNANFIVLEDGSLYANAANISGNIYADNGYIGGLKIDNGIKGYVGDNESFSLTADGLSITNSLAKLQIGNFQTYYDALSKNTYWQTNGALYIQGMDANEQPITSIELLTETGDESVSGTISIQTVSRSNNLIGVKLVSTTAFYYPVRKVLYYEGRGRFESFDNNDNEGSILLTIPAGKTESATGYMSITSYTEMRFKLAEETEWHGNVARDDLPMGVTYGAVSETQYRPKNNIIIQGNIMPKSHDTYNIGSSDYRWKYIYGYEGYFNNVYNSTGTITSSDFNKKHAIEEVNNEYSYMFDLLRPVSFKYNDKKSDRLHIGFIAQDVKEAVLNAGLTTQSFAGYCEWQNDNGIIECGLRYEEFIALCVNEIQKLKKRVAELENK